MLRHFLFKKIDNSGLLLFRMIFGILICLECYGAIATGWIRRTLIEPKFTFTFIGFEWLQPLPGNGMYFYYFIMGTLGLLVAAGYKYRWSMIAFTVLWTATYLMQKSSYNNHYYLLILISFIMCFLPANRGYSLDSRADPSLVRHSMYHYIKWLFVLQLFIVYTYAAVAKLYADWLDFSFVKVLMQSKASYIMIGGVLQNLWLHKVIAIAGVFFDLLIVPALLWRRTRMAAFVFSIFFHLFNSIVFQIGIFPYLSLAFTLFFFDPEAVRARFFKRKSSSKEDEEDLLPSRMNWMYFGWGVYFLIQTLLPLRHHFIKDDVLWTEEGHRMSWRMMLRNRNGIIQFRVVRKDNQSSELIKLKDYLTQKQMNRVASYPDFIWQFAQYLRKEHARKGIPVSVFVKSEVSINGKPRSPFIDPEADLAAEHWAVFEHNDWILPSPWSAPDRTE